MFDAWNRETSYFVLVQFEPKKEKKGEAPINPYIIHCLSITDHKGGFSLRQNVSVTVPTNKNSKRIPEYDCNNSSAVINIMTILYG